MFAGLLKVLTQLLCNERKCVQEPFHANCAFFFRDARNMARDVHNILLKVVMERGNMTELNAANYIKKMDMQKRYSSDVWS